MNKFGKPFDYSRSHVSSVSMKISRLSRSRKARIAETTPSSSLLRRGVPYSKTNRARSNSQAPFFLDSSNLIRSAEKSSTRQRSNSKYPQGRKATKCKTVDSCFHLLKISETSSGLITVSPQFSRPPKLPNFVVAMFKQLARRIRQVPSATLPRSKCGLLFLPASQA